MFNICCATRKYKTRPEKERVTLNRLQFLKYFGLDCLYNYTTLEIKKYEPENCDNNIELEWYDAYYGVYPIY